MINLLLVLAVFGLPGVYGLYAALKNPLITGTNRQSYERVSTRVFAAGSSAFFVLVASGATYHLFAG